ncbi:MAG: HAMP domain-containing sensor histidine kinase [Sulfurovum sp.]|nr:HAMP domain-containing sensor histidine kinase [Sulfurovum sp.]
MNSLEKKSFYSFLGLYILTSLFAIFFIAYWYYTAQKSALENETYYRLGHLADKKAGSIIIAHMEKRSLPHMKTPKDITLALLNTKMEVLEGELLVQNLPIEVGYFEQNSYNILISDASYEHLNICYIVVQSNMLGKDIQNLQTLIARVLALASLFIVIIAWILSSLFMRPMRQRIVQIERFINDITHELNTPITSLSMATNQALKLGEYSGKTMKNISISTKQLYDIYHALTYLNFANKKDTSSQINLEDILEKSVLYYSPLAEIKRITFEISLEKTLFSMPQTPATLLFGNLIGNAIKYSSPHSKIRLILKENHFTIEDEGIGIAEEKQKEIFVKFKRGTEYSGGFGVGLSIVKNICDEYDIEIGLESTLDKGTTFTLMFS